MEFLKKIVGDSSVPTTSPLDELITGLNEAQNDPSFEPYNEKITHILTGLNNLKRLAGLDPKLTISLDLPLRYFKKFMTQHKILVENNPDVATVMIQNVLENIEAFIIVADNMAKEMCPSERSLMGKLDKAQQCTLDTYGSKMEKQKAYSCVDCGLLAPKMICEPCAQQCHVGHKLKPLGMISCFCDCRLLTQQCILQQSCTYEASKETYIPQIKYVCISCQMEEKGDDILCHFCIMVCHKGHVVKSVGPVKGFCDCRSKFDFCKKRFE